MNILIFSWRDIKHPNAGGAEISTHEHAKGWVKVGYNVTHFSSHFNIGKREEIIDGVRYVRRGFQYGGVQFWGMLWYFFGKHKKFDIVIDQFHGIPFFTPLYVRKKKLAFIHEVTKEVWKLNPWKNPYHHVPAIVGPMLEPFIFKLLYRRVPFMTVSESTKLDLMEWGISDKDITVVYNGTNTVRVNKKKEHKKTAIFLGAIAKDKGIEDALRVFAEINKKEADWQFWVVGKSAAGYLKYLKDKARMLNINNIKFWGYVSEREKFELLARARVFINPSVREGWGLVNIEANSVGTPVVGYKVAGMRDSVKDGKTGILVNRGDYEGLASNAIGLANNEKLYNQLRGGALKWSKQFNWSKSTKKSLELVRQVVNNEKTK